MRQIRYRGAPEWACRLAVVNDDDVVRARLERYEAALRGADDPARIQRLIAPFAPNGSILVVTVSGLAAARRQVGPQASRRDLLAALAAMQGIASDPAAPWLKESKVDGFFRGVIKDLASGTSFAGVSMDNRAVFLNVLRCPMMFWFTDLLPVEEAACVPLDACALHEVGHLVEYQRKLRIAERHFREVPNRLPLPGADPAATVDLRRAMSWHAGECFADAFQVAAALAAGLPEPVVRRSVVMENARLFDAEMVARLSADAFWSKHRLWQGIYCTLGATTLALRGALARPPGATWDLDAVASIAQRAARRGALPADVLFAVAQDRPPEWLMEMDGQGAAREAHRLVAVRNARPSRAWDPEPLATLADPTARLLRLTAMRASLGLMGRYVWDAQATVVRTLADTWLLAVLGEDLAPQIRKAALP